MANPYHRLFQPISMLMIKINLPENTNSTPDHNNSKHSVYRRDEERAIESKRILTYIYTEITDLADRTTH